MNNYKLETSPQFDKDIEKISKNFELQKRLKKKIEEIMIAPYSYKPLRNVLKNKRRVHIGNFVLIFEVNEEKKSIIFRTFKHHDKAYK